MLKSVLGFEASDGNQVLVKLCNCEHDFISKFLIIVPIFWIAGKAQWFSVNHTDGSKRVPTSPAGQGVSAADDVDGDNWGMGTGGDQSDPGFGFS